MRPSFAYGSLQVTSIDIRHACTYLFVVKSAYFLSDSTCMPECKALEIDGSFHFPKSA